MLASNNALCFTEVLLIDAADIVVYMTMIFIGAYSADHHQNRIHLPPFHVLWELI